MPAHIGTWPTAGHPLWQGWACRLASRAGRHGRHRTAWSIYSLLAARGHGESHFQLGLILESGHGRPSDGVRSTLHYRHAALLGHQQAQYRLASRYASGQGIMRDEHQALFWYHQAARQGHAEARQYLRGMAIACV